MKKRMSLLAATTLLACAAVPASAEGWCDMAGGWQVVTHGGMADNVFILGRLQGGTSDIWIQIASASVGKSNVAVAIAAQIAGRNLSLYLDSPSATCSNFASWQPVNAIRHVRLTD